MASVSLDIGDGLVHEQYLQCSYPCVHQVVVGQWWGERQPEPAPAPAPAASLIMILRYAPRSLGRSRRRRALIAHGWGTLGAAVK